MEYKIVTKFLKDISFEVPNAETLLLFENDIHKYNLKIDIKSKVIKNKLIQVDTILKFLDETASERKAQVEVTVAAVANIDGDLTDKEKLERTLLVSIPTEIYPYLFEVFSFLIEKSGLPKLKVEKTVDFEKLYQQRNK
ncbi:MAG: hypothetical protein CBC24_05300 [Candidatus Pelagibacter sp. TMED64]|nr:protein-export protein SecB [Candidatus Pelagibacter sp.]OUU65542.1 MAG: hypothetical protein CBC24_05300 [Candidatus Pelagibacter sp. TMED64]|tara:strand:- start:22630 stop:23046 length:417 start_codon:yes stop_codon:yes gene_type:complete